MSHGLLLDSFCSLEKYSKNNHLVRVHDLSNYSKLLDTNRITLPHDSSLNSMGKHVFKIWTITLMSFYVIPFSY